MKKWGIVLLTSITAAVLGAAMCMAEERIPAEEPLAPNYTPYIEIPDVTASDSISIVCDQEPVLGQEGIWSIVTPFDTYAFSLCESIILLPFLHLYYSINTAKVNTKKQKNSTKEIVLLFFIACHHCHCFCHYRLG